MDFMNQIKKTLDDKTQLTENGAVGFNTTGVKLLDINFKISSLRNMKDEEICNLFSDVYFENKLLALKWLFYLRDVRGGQGERRSFRIIFKWLISVNENVARGLLPLISEYGRWDDLISLLESNLKDDIIKLVRTQLRQDLIDMKEDKPISLLAKWMPSSNASSIKTRVSASVLRNELEMTKKKYNFTLSTLRTYLKIVEKLMTQNEWSEIDYSSVPSKANLVYSNAFYRHDEERRLKYLESLKNGEVKINAGVLYPHDIVHKYFGSFRRIKNYDETIEQLWKALPNMISDENDTLCVTDGSGSMLSTVGNISVTALEVANALTIYFSEHCNGAYKNKYITFSSHPQFVNFSNAVSLREKLEIAKKYNEVSNTNIESVFDLILQTAIDNNLKQNEIPGNILILSDMEFDDATSGNSWKESSFKSLTKTLFEEIEEKYNLCGYKLPRLIFWNIMSRSGSIPVKENSLGVTLVSGFSTNTIKMVTSGELDPYKCLLEQLEIERYNPIEEVFNLTIK